MSWTFAYTDDVEWRSCYLLCWTHSCLDGEIAITQEMSFCPGPNRLKSTIETDSALSSFQSIWNPSMSTLWTSRFLSLQTGWLVQHRALGSDRSKIWVTLRHCQLPVSEMCWEGGPGQRWCSEAFMGIFFSLNDLVNCALCAMLQMCIWTKWLEVWILIVKIT